MADLTLPAGLQVFERGWLSSNNILAASDEHTCLIDSGYCTHSAQTLALVGQSLNGRKLDQLFNTHLHSDHCGGNAALQAAYPALETFIPPGEAVAVANWNAEDLSYERTGQLCPAFRFTKLIGPGSTLRFGSTDWEAHAAGGHDPHSLVFFEPIKKIIISADALWEKGFGVIFPELDGIDAFDDAGRTLDLIDRLAPRIVIPGHGAVFAYSPEIANRARSRLENFVRHPLKHARHAAKVLLKFKLLEMHQATRDQLLEWARPTPLLGAIHGRFYRDISIDLWIDELCTELERASAIRFDNGQWLNL
jgi:glyoxylase-like metal-dependent hydrolase (beta-lactamase superfamily II)